MSAVLLLLSFAHSYDVSSQRKTTNVDSVTLVSHGSHFPWESHFPSRLPIEKGGTRNTQRTSSKWPETGIRSTEIEIPHIPADYRSAAG